jgi:hypothetical protein
VPGFREGGAPEIKDKTNKIVFLYGFFTKYADWNIRF